MPNFIAEIKSLIERDEWAAAARLVGESVEFPMTAIECSELLVSAAEECPDGDDGLPEYGRRMEPVLDFAAALLARGADPNYQPSGRSMPPLHTAAFRGSFELVVFLVGRGADPKTPMAASPERDAMSVDGTALHLAAGNGYVYMSEFLLRHGCPVDATGVAGQTPLHVAVILGRAKIVELLLNHGADIDRRCGTSVGGPFLSGETPLHVAVAFMQPEAAAMLIHRGASTEIRCHLGLTAKDVLERRRFRVFVTVRSSADELLRQLQSVLD